MEHIHNTNNDFVFDSITVNKPLSIQNGNFFMKVSKQGNPLYVQTPKCNIKQTKQDVYLSVGSDGEQKSETLEKTKKKVTKKNYCDFVVPNDEEKFIKWFEDLEHHIQKKIHENHSKWFDVELELEDIEVSFTSPLKQTKTNKNSILRTNLPNLEKTILKIYNEDEQELVFDDLDDSMNVMSILEIQGIKYSGRSFQIEIELKQMLVLKSVNIFDKCIFKPRETKIEKIDTPLENFQEKEHELIMENVVEPEPEPEPEVQPEPEPETETETENIILEKQEVLDNVNENIDESQENIEEKKESIKTIENEVIEENTIKVDSLGNSNLEFKEIELDLDKIPEEEKVEIKQRNTVYYEMYKEARRKAKVARDLALSSYLEAKRIKTTYLLDDIIDSDESSIDVGDDSDSDDSENDTTENIQNENDEKQNEINEEENEKNVE